MVYVRSEEGLSNQEFFGVSQVATVNGRGTDLEHLTRDVTARGDNDSREQGYWTARKAYGN